MESGELSKTVEVGANILLDVIDRFFPFCGLTKRALDVYISEIEKSDKPKEYKAWEIMRAKKEFKKLSNIKSIIEVAQEYCTEEDLKKNSYSENEEWFDYFFEKAGNISDESVQQIWGQILANEIKDKGKTPRSVISVLSEIDSQLAKLFMLVCAHRLIFVPLDEHGSALQNLVFKQVIIFNNDEYYRNKGINLLVLNELEAIGLISSNNLGYLKRIPLAKKVLISDGVFTECVLVEKGELNTGDIMLTRAGLYLLNTINPQIAGDQHEVTRDYYLRNGYVFEETNKKVVIVDDNHYRIETITL